VVARQARQQREQRYAQARLDSAGRADSVRKANSARADSVRSATLLGGMVDTAARAQQLRKDSIANARNAIQAAVLTAIRQYAMAVQSGDTAAARTVFPNVSSRELGSWDNARQKYDLKLAVVQPRQAKMSMNNLVADVDFILQVRYIDRATRGVYNSTVLPRHATLTKQGQRWQLDALTAR
jgi:hypothetical protein